MTVYRKLKDMEKYYVAEYIGRGKWRALEVNLDSVAKVLLTSGKGERERQKHTQERRYHNLILKKGRLGKP